MKLQIPKIEISRFHNQERFLKEDRRMRSRTTTVPTVGQSAAHSVSRMKKALSLSFALVAALGFASNAAAVDVYLNAVPVAEQLTTNGGTLDVPTWKFVCDDAAATNDACLDTTAGARLDAAQGDSLTIFLNNTLATEVSLVIPGQIGTAKPKFFAVTGTQPPRLKSLAEETAAGGSGTYTWNSLKAGTFLYQSGTFQSLQVPMGLHGALVVSATGACPAGIPAYGDDAGGGNATCHDTEAVVIFSEIDPVQNQQTADAATALTPISTACADAAPAYPCSIDYSPTYLLINGEQTLTSPLLEGAQGDVVLMRFLNAGLRSHTPTILGQDMGLLAEDGNRYPGLVKQQSAVLLAAGKTLDALTAMPTEDITFSLFDRMPSFSNDGQAHSSTIASLVVGLGSPGPVLPNPQVPVVRNVIEDTPKLLNVPGGNSLQLISGAGNGTVEAILPGTAPYGNGQLAYLYSPNADFSGVDGFSYYRPGNDTVYNVTINVSFVNDVPVSADDSFTNTAGGTLTVPAPGVLANDIDVDGDILTATLVNPVPGLALASDGTVTYSGTGIVNFSYVADDLACGAACPTSNVTLNVNPTSDIALTVEDPEGEVINAYRWLVQEDTTFKVDPSNPGPISEGQSVNFHKSYMPVIAQGCVGQCTDANSISIAEFPLSEAALDPTKHYYVSVLPNDAGTGTGHTIGGAQIAPGAGARSVSVIVNKQEVPTAQISVLTFDDRSPTNGVPDAGEQPLGGFQIIVEDAGGRYGISGGTMSQDAFGNPLTNSLFGEPGCPGTSPVGIILTCPDGRALIKNLPPGKFGVIAVPPIGAAETWTQTSTIEGSKVIDAWVKADEPPFFVEFGAPGPHAFFGFVDPASTVVPPQLPGTNFNDVTGRVTLLHDPRPPGTVGGFDSESYAGLAHTRAWVALNTIGGDGPNIATVQADGDGNFSFSGIPDGSYQLVAWDSFLNQIIAFKALDLAGGTGAFDEKMPVNAWFSRSEHNVFIDDNENGILDGGEKPLQEQEILLRWRDGTVNQAFPTDTEGFVSFDQTFPFFSWQVMEVAYTRHKATGLTVIVDGGGDVDESEIMSVQVGGPQISTGPVLTQGFQGFPGQTNIFNWGKKPYVPGENGGISGIVFYGSTRGENDPRLTVGDPWEPGIPRVTVRLLREVARADGSTALALVQETQTDSWDDSLPTGCLGETGTDYIDQTLAGDAERCYDGWRNWNQARPAVFDGGYAFNDIPPGKYVVEVVPPPGYELIKEEDLNVGFGDTFGSAASTGFAPVPVVLPNGMLVLVTPDAAAVAAVLAGAQPGIAQPACVGAYHTVAPSLSLFPGEPAPFANTDRPLCDRKAVVLSDQGQAAADFHLFTTTPIAAQFTGLVTDDISNDFNPISPGLGEKFSPAYLPISLRDFKGAEVYRTYGDAYGRYNGVTPSTFTANSPIPSGYSPAMITACLNDPGDGPELDPLVQPGYGTACYTGQFMPGANTYLDTPVLPNAAFAGGYSPADCAAPTGTPLITVVRGVGTGEVGPWINSNVTNKRLIIRSEGNLRVPNPAYEGPAATGLAGRALITRDFGFGSLQGKVMVGDIELEITQWANGVIRASFPAGTAEVTGRLSVTRGDNGNVSSNGVTVTVSNEPVIGVTNGGSIQAAIDAASEGQLILVGPGTYSELLIMDKPVRLQGSGTRTIISAIKRPLEKLDVWQMKLDNLFASGAVDALPGQDLTFTMEQGPGVTVVAKRTGPGRFSLWPSRIDGFTVSGAVGGGGILVSGYATNLEVSNNYVSGNSGILNGGIRVGHPFLPLDGAGPFNYNVGVNVHHNTITNNGAVGQEATGGGVAIATGSTSYEVAENFICGNYTQGDGAGVGHLGLSRAGKIIGNTILFNQSANASLTNSGGGVFVGGIPAELPLEPNAVQEVLTRGSGTVTIDGNLIQGNIAATGHGGGIRTQLINGDDVAANPTTPNSWYSVIITNNVIVNNLVGWSGAGISLQDTVNARIINNTIANNDSTATAGPLIDLATNTSEPQPAGVSVFGHSLALSTALNVAGGFSNPLLLNNIIWHNRSFHYDTAQLDGALVPALAQSAIGECVAGAEFWDLGVIGAVGSMNPRRSVLSDTTGYNGSNVSTDPSFVNEYCNGARTLLNPGPLLATAAQGEGGNFIDVRYGPLSNPGSANVDPFDYHILPGGSAYNSTFGGPALDFDKQQRPAASAANRVRDIGADEALGEVTFTEASLGTLGGDTLDFGAQSGGNIQSTVTLSVGSSAVIFGVLDVTGDMTGGVNPQPRFSIVPGQDNCSGLAINVGNTCTVTIRFRSGGNAERNGILSVPHNGNGSSNSLALTGF